MIECCLALLALCVHCLKSLWLHCLLCVSFACYLCGCRLDCLLGVCFPHLIFVIKEYALCVLKLPLAFFFVNLQVDRR